MLIGDDDPLGSFIFRTTGFNSIRTLAEAQRLDDWHQQTGFDQKALDRAAKAGFANGAFQSILISRGEAQRFAEMKGASLPSCTTH